MGTALPRELLWQAKQMYDELDEHGRRRWSMIQVAAKLGISETSVLRAVKNQGRFANINAAPLPQTRSEKQWAQDAKESEARLMERIKQDAAAAAKPRADPYAGMMAEGKTATRIPPPSPLDGGDAPEDSDGSGLKKLVTIAGAGEVMLDELIKGENDGTADTSK